MHRRLFFALVFYLSVTTILSIRCYVGTDAECMYASDTNSCGSNGTCLCAKFLLQCTQEVSSCNQYEQSSNVKKWVYTTISPSACQYLKTQSSVYENVTCCSQNRCNRPTTVTCSLSAARREALRKIHHLLDV